jgi:branched-chain amino acid transport system permease protein
LPASWDLDGITSGAIYALVAIALVLVFAVTRIVFIPQGEFVAFGALTMALFQTGKVPGTVWLLMLMATVATLMDVAQAVREPLGAGTHAA